MNQITSINAADHPIGRFCSNLIRYLKENPRERVEVYGIGQLFFTNKEATIAKYQKIMSIGSILKGPFLHRSVNRLFHRTLRGMLSRSITQKALFKRVRGHTTMAPINSLRILGPINYRRASIITLTELSHSLGFSKAPLTQQQSVGLLSQMSRVQIPGGAQIREE